MATPHFICQMVEEADAMIRFAAGQGLALPPEVPVHINQLKVSYIIDGEPNWEPISSHELTMLIECHGKLAKLIEPAKPKSIALMKRDADDPSVFHFLGPVQLIRKLSIVAILCLLSTILVSTSPHVNLTTINQGLFNSQGVTLLLNQLFLLSCAGLGATFASLNKVNEYIKVGSYDPKFDSTYWTLFIMGLMGGVIIAELIPVSQLAEGSSAAAASFHKPVAALLGGFSADVIYRILSRLVDVLGQALGLEAKQQTARSKRGSTIKEQDHKLEPPVVQSAPKTKQVEKIKKELSLD